MPGPEDLFFDGDSPPRQFRFLLVRYLRRTAHGAAKEIENVRRFHGVSAKNVLHTRQYCARDVLGLNAASAIEEIRDRGQRVSEAV